MKIIVLSTTILTGVIEFVVVSSQKLFDKGLIPSEYVWRNQIVIFLHLTFGFYVVSYEIKGKAIFRNGGNGREWIEKEMWLKMTILGVNSELICHKTF